MSSVDTGVIVLILSAVSLLLLIGVTVSMDEGSLTPGRIGVLFLGVIVVPCLSLTFGVGAAMDEAKRVGFCGTRCHEMAPFYEDLRSPESETLAAIHYQNRYILEDQCYSCHTNYTMFGPMEAKVAGLMHIWNHYAGHSEKPIKLKGEYRIANCLHCHGESKRYRESHTELLAEIENGDMSCLICHGQIHPQQDAKVDQ